MIIDNYRRWKSRSTTKGVAVVDPRSNATLRFRAGIDHSFARKLRAKLATFNAEQQAVQIMRCDALDNRWTVSADGQLLAAEKKTALDQVNLALIAHDYDIRINVATETPDPVIAAGEQGGVVIAAGPVVDRSKWIVERRKKRTAYTSKDPALGKWRIDYTEVDIQTRNPNGGMSKPKKEMELEFELERGPMLEWLQEQSDPQAVEKTRVLAQQLVQLLDVCLPFESEAEKETSLVVVHDLHYDHEIGVLNSLLTGRPVPTRADTDRLSRSRGGAFEFPGSMPVNLTRQNLQEVQSSDYFITEKSDGVRFLLYVVPEAQSKTGEAVAVLVDRSKTIFKFRGCEAVGRALGLGCILDGELVFNRSLRENVFLVFDSLLWRHRSLIECPFSERLERVAKEILPTCSRSMNEIMARMVAEQQGPHLLVKPLQLIRKAFVTRKELGVLLGKMRLEDGERVFFDADPGQTQSRRHHKSDGFIFQPNSRYVFSRHYELLKWKWPELRSVDLQVCIPMEAGTGDSGGTAGGAGSNGSSNEWPIYLMCAGPQETQINCTKRGDTNVGLGEFDAYRLLADMECPEMAAKGGAAIVEVAYDIQIGMWAYLHLRKDKNQPNYIDSVLGVFTEQAEAISIEELQYSLTAAAFADKGMKNDFEAQVSKMKGTLLGWQRAEAAKLSGSSGSSNGSTVTRK